MVIRDNIVSKVTIYRLDVPLIKPYKLSYNTFYSFEPLLIHILDDQGNASGLVYEDASNIFNDHRYVWGYRCIYKEFYTSFG